MICAFQSCILAQSKEEEEVAAIGCRTKNGGGGGDFSSTFYTGEREEVEKLGAEESGTAGARTERLMEKKKRRKRRRRRRRGHLEKRKKREEVSCISCRPSLSGNEGGRKEGIRDFLLLIHYVFPIFLPLLSPPSPLKPLQVEWGFLPVRKEKRSRGAILTRRPTTFTFPKRKKKRKKASFFPDPDCSFSSCPFKVEWL